MSFIVPLSFRRCAALHSEREQASVVVTVAECKGGVRSSSDLHLCLVFHCPVCRLAQRIIKEAVPGRTHRARSCPGRSPPRRLRRSLRRQPGWTAGQWSKGTPRKRGKHLNTGFPAPRGEDRNLTVLEAHSTSY